MANITFSNLPAEIQVSIAKYCGNNHLINLCLTSKQVNQTCLHVLYRHVDLHFDPPDVRDLNRQESPQSLDARKRQQQFVYTLLRHPEYGMHVRSITGSLFVLSISKYHNWEETVSDEELWRAMQSLKHVQRVEVGSRGGIANPMMVPTKQFPTSLFHSATSVRLVGHMQYGLAKAILHAINPATLEHLCLDMVEDYKLGRFHPGYVSGEISGLLTTLTGRCRVLRTLMLRREGRLSDERRWHASLEDPTNLIKDPNMEENAWFEKVPTAEEKASYFEWPSFIRSVQGTLEEFTFEQGAKSTYHLNFGKPYMYRFMDERFRRCYLPVIVSGNWPSLTVMELRGVRRPDCSGGKAALKNELRAALGTDVKILVRGTGRFWRQYSWPYQTGALKKTSR